MRAERGQLLRVFCKQAPGNGAPAQVDPLSRRCDRNDILESSRNNQQQLKWHQAAIPGLAAASGSLLSIWFFCGSQTRSDAATLILFSVSLSSGLWYATFSVHWFSFHNYIEHNSWRCRIRIDTWNTCAGMDATSQTVGMDSYRCSTAA